MKTKWKIIIGLLIIGFIGTLFDNKKESGQDTVSKAPKVELTYQEEFDKAHFNSLSGYYKPVKNYLKEYLNDPGSLDIDKTWCRMNADSTFSVKTLFRAKNQFNALVKQSMYCDIDIDGNLSNIKFE